MNIKDIMKSAMLYSAGYAIFTQQRVRSFFG
jgi:hypothetical protein